MAKQFLIHLTPEEWGDFIMTVSDGFSFINRLEIGGAEWRYSVSGVQLGEATREILRYKTRDFSSWRVIYGDLHVRPSPADHAWQ